MTTTIEPNHEPDGESRAAAAVTSAPESISMASLPPEVLTDILGRMSIPELSKAIATSEAFADIGADILHRRAERARRALCPPGKESLCEGSLLCAIAANDDDAVRDILLARHTTPGQAKQLCGTGTVTDLSDLLNHTPCRILVAWPKLFTAKVIMDDCKEAWWEDVACGSGAWRTLAMIIPDVMRRIRSPTTLRRLLNEAIYRMGRCVWFGYWTSPTTEEEGNDLEFSHEKNLSHAASAISWEGQSSAMPFMPRSVLDWNFSEAVKHGEISWKVKIYNAPAVAHAILGHVLPSIHYRLMGWLQAEFGNPFHVSLDALEGFILYLIEWVSGYYDIEKAHGSERAREQFARGMPSAYMQVLHDMRPFFHFTIPEMDHMRQRDQEYEHERILLTFDTLRNLLENAVDSLTGWPDLVGELLDAGFFPQNTFLHRGQWEGPDIEDIISVIEPLDRPMESWLGFPVIGSIHDRMKKMVEEKLRPEEMYGPHW